jgi:hypothetical protein
MEHSGEWPADAIDLIGRQRGEIERLAAESEARHQSCLVLMKSVHDHRAEIERLRAAVDSAAAILRDAPTVRTTWGFRVGEWIARNAVSAESNGS